MIHVEGYHEYRGGVQYRGGTQITKDYSPYSTAYPRGTHDIPHIYHDIPHGTQDVLHGTYMSPTVLNTHYTE